MHFHSYTSNRINPQNNKQITSIQGFFLLNVGPPHEKFSGSAPVTCNYLENARSADKKIETARQSCKKVVHIFDIYSVTDYTYTESHKSVNQNHGHCFYKNTPYEFEYLAYFEKQSSG